MKLLYHRPLVIAVSLALSVLLISTGQAQSDSKGSGTKNADKMKPVKFTDGVAQLTPKNSKIEFIGIHVGDKPDPRLGGFEKFKGQVKLADDNSVESISLDIDINSIWTQFDKLTAHLKNADFFETNKFGRAKFVSTKIEANEKGMTVTGNLTMHGSTKEISFPVKGNLDKSGVVMTSEFKLDRSLFGMDKMTSGVDKMVSVKFVVGKPTKSSKSMPGPGTTSQTESDGETKLVQVKLSAPNMT